MPEDVGADTTLALLRSSVARLGRIVEPLDDATLERPAYPSEWSIAQVLSHLGSGAEIMQRRLDDTESGRETPESFAPSVWDDWNAKSPRAQVRRCARRRRRVAGASRGGRQRPVPTSWSSTWAH